MIEGHTGCINWVGFQHTLVEHLALPLLEIFLGSYFSVDTMEVLPYDALDQFFVCSNMLGFCALGVIVHQTLLE